jgi:hypothetical protein
LQLQEEERRRSTLGLMLTWCGKSGTGIGERGKVREREEQKSHQTLDSPT